jgi:hypothetical protein
MSTVRYGIYFLHAHQCTQSTLHQAFSAQCKWSARATLASSSCFGLAKTIHIVKQTIYHMHGTIWCVYTVLSTPTWVPPLQVRSCFHLQTPQLISFQFVAEAVLANHHFFPTTPYFKFCQGLQRPRPAAFSILPFQRQLRTQQPWPHIYSWAAALPPATTTAATACRRGHPDLWSTCSSAGGKGVGVLGK